MKQVIVMRKDLKMRKGKMCAQAAHASMATLLTDMRLHPFRWIGMILFYMIKKRWPYTNNFGKWLNGPFTKIVVGVENDGDLGSIKTAAHFDDIHFSTIADAGKTEFHGKITETCIGLYPMEEEEVNKVTGHLTLL